MSCEHTALDAIAEVCRLERELLDAQVFALTYREMWQMATDAARQREARILSLEVQIMAVREEIRSYVRGQMCS